MNVNNYPTTTPVFIRVATENLTSMARVVVGVVVGFKKNQLFVFNIATQQLPGQWM